jgi:hypothetical protein
MDYKVSYEWPTSSIAYGKEHFRESRLKTKYGMTGEQFDLLLQDQGGVCKICGKTNAPTRMNLLGVDHCHATGKIRGLLCIKCNSGLGFFEDDINRMKAAIEYLLCSRTQ